MGFCFQVFGGFKGLRCSGLGFRFRGSEVVEWESGVWVFRGQGFRMPCLPKLLQKEVGRLLSIIQKQEAGSTR